jgi:hypothetical protein
MSNNQEKKTERKELKLQEMTVNQVGEWIEAIFPSESGLKEIFIKNRINGEKLVKLTNEVLRDDLKIEIYGLRQDILTEVSKIEGIFKF